MENHITPLMRSAMMAEAVSTCGDFGISAVLHVAEPPTLQDAVLTELYEKISVVLAFSAIHESQIGDAMYWRGMATDDAQVRDEGDRLRLAWLLAMKALEEETGAAFMAHARIITGDYADDILNMEHREPADYTEELEQLRAQWHCMAEGVE